MASLALFLNLAVSSGRIVMGRKNRSLKRTKKTIAIVGEGKTEWHYFDQLRSSEDLGFTLKPEKPKNSNIDNLKNKCVELIRNEFDVVFCIFYLDKICNNRKIEKKYRNIKKEFKRINKESKKVHSKNKKKVITIELMPCFEMWFLLHYSSNPKRYLKCKNLIRNLSDYIKNYSKGKTYYTKLINKLPKALTNAKKINRSAKNICDKKCEINKIIEFILPR